jgi:poly-gamma-glutamate capsule biosynthesis protein CapA/YwtB (metallophosphatase superfamily)
MTGSDLRDSLNARIAAVGAAMFTQRIRTIWDPRFREVVQLIKSADAAFVNLEAPIYEPEAHPVKQFVYTSYVTSEPWVADELAACGFNLVSLANNHMSDWSPQSIERNIRELQRAGIVCSGAGMSVSDARAPGYLDLPGGRIALISVDSSWEYGQFINVQTANDSRLGVKARPGTNGLRWYSELILEAAEFDQLQLLHRRLGLELEGLETAHIRPLPGPDTFWFRGSVVIRGHPSRVRTFCDERDLAAIAGWIDTARAQADIVVVSHHNHQARGQDWELPAEFAEEFAHAAIDAGADTYIGHGYTSKGIELYRGKPIFYDIGDWATQDASARRHPADAYDRWQLDSTALPGDFATAREAAWRAVRVTGADPEYRSLINSYKAALDHSVIAVLEVANGEISDVTLHPCTTSSGPRRHHRGLPLLADAERGEQIIERLQRASAPYGTGITWNGKVGRLVLEAGSNL